MGEGKWNSLTLPKQPLPKTAETRATRALLSCDFPHGGRWWMVQGEGTCEWAPGFSSYAGCYQRGPFPLTRTEYWILRGKTGGSREWWRERQIRLSEGMNEKQILLLVSQIPSNSPFTRPWGQLASEAPKRPSVTPSMPHATHLTHTRSTPWPAAVHADNMVSTLWERALADSNR